MTAHYAASDLSTAPTRIQHGLLKYPGSFWMKKWHSLHAMQGEVMFRTKGALYYDWVLLCMQSTTCGLDKIDGCKCASELDLACRE